MPLADALLLTHGAGGGDAHRLLIAIENGLEIPVRRMEFPYRREGRKAPDRAPKLVQAVIDEVESFSGALGIGPERVALGGRSMGGRMCSMAVADGLLAAGLVLLSYPLHPPGKPERLRTEHFGDIAVPTLFCNGDRDPFGTPAELEREIPAIGRRVVVHWIEGQRHDPAPASYDEIVEVVRTFLGA